MGSRWGRDGVEMGSKLDRIRSKLVESDRNLSNQIETKSMILETKSMILETKSTGPNQILTQYPIPNPHIPNYYTMDTDLIELSKKNSTLYERNGNIRSHIMFLHHLYIQDRYHIFYSLLE